MTTYNKTTLKTFFETGDVPQGSDFANFIDSYVNLVETAEQDMAGPLYTTKLITPRVSAGSINVTGGEIVGNGITAKNLTISGSATLSSDVTVSGQLTAAAGTFIGIVSAAGVVVNGNIAGSGALNINGAGTFGTTVKATKVSSQTAYNGIAIISAAGSTQATAGPISATVGICRLQGTTDGAQTGYILPSPAALLGMVQNIVHEGAVSGNLWPSIGCQINGLAANTPFALAATTPYRVIYTQVSGYGVK